MQHTHYIYEIVMTEEQQHNDTPLSYLNSNPEQEMFQISAISHSHDIPEDDDCPTHTHMPDPIKAGRYIEDEEPAAPTAAQAA